MFAVDDAVADAIRRAYEDGGELAAVDASRQGLRCERKCIGEDLPQVTCAGAPARSLGEAAARGYAIERGVTPAREEDAAPPLPPTESGTPVRATLETQGKRYSSRNAVISQPFHFRLAISPANNPR